jgi:hypothetical protein
VVIGELMTNSKTYLLLNLLWMFSKAVFLIFVSCFLAANGFGGLGLLIAIFMGVDFIFELVKDV